MNIKWRTFKVGGMWYAYFRHKGQRYERSTGISDPAKKHMAMLEAARIEERIVQGAEGSSSMAARLTDGYKLWESAPRRKTAAKQQCQQVRRGWEDFLAWLDEVHPDVRFADQVTARIARDYARKVASEGILYSRGATLSPRSINAYLGYVRSVFRVLSEDGEFTSPFKAVQNRSERPVHREAFTEDELTALMSCDDPVVVQAVTVGAYTGLRAGDLCRLKWSHVDESAGVIRLTTGKTHTRVVVPILPPVQRLLADLPRSNGYVMPDVAAVYAEPNGMAERMKAAMDKLGIIHQTTRDNGRQQSIKGLHALRHTFVYLCAKSGVPMPAVQRAVGHMTAAMTQMYANHASEQDIRAMMAKIPDLA